MPELLVVIDGTTRDLRSCHWVLFDGNDCAHASEYGDGATSADQAHKNFTPRQRDRDRQTRQGFHIELLSKEQWRKQAGPCFHGTCTHRKPEATSA